MASERKGTREPVREGEREREPRETECIANVLRVPILETTPRGIQEPREKDDGQVPGGREEGRQG